MVALIMVGLLALSGCGAILDYRPMGDNQVERLVWHKDGGTQEEYSKDKYQCEQDASIYRDGSGTEGMYAAVYTSFEGVSPVPQMVRLRFLDCMKIKGYSSTNQNFQQYPKQTYVERCGKLANEAPSDQWLKTYQACIKESK